MSITVKEFGTLPDGRTVHSYELENASGSGARLIDFGAILVSLCVSDKDGKKRDVVLGYDSIDGYLTNKCFFGSTIGRNGNRIAKGAFSIGEKKYQLAINENDNNLHSGPDGFEKKLWKGECLEAENAVRFSRLSPDGENGFPGNMQISVTYTLTEQNELCITYEGESDQATIANLTNHSYFNLNGEGSGDILGHELTLKAAGFTPVQDAASIPTGEVRPVAGTVMDFTTPHQVGERIDAQDEQLLFTGGYDHNYVCDDYEPGKIRPVATVVSRESGIKMTVLTECPCIQFYAGNFVSHQEGKNGHVYEKRSGLCLETQVEPNAVNDPAFHSPVIGAGEKYLSRTIYRFEVL